MFYVSYKTPSLIKDETHLKELLSQLQVKYYYSKIHRLRILSAVDLIACCESNQCGLYCTPRPHIIQHRNIFIHLSIPVFALDSVSATPILLYSTKIADKIIPVKCTHIFPSDMIKTKAILQMIEGKIKANLAHGLLYPFDRHTCKVTLHSLGTHLNI